MKQIFTDALQQALKKGRLVIAEIDGEEFTLRIDRTHGECVCRFDGETETPLFSVKYLDATWKVGKDVR